MIKKILEILHSKRDYAGNCYWAFRFTDCMTGKTVCATVSGGQSNIEGIPFYLNGESWEPHDTRTMISPLGIREFDRTVKQWPHGGCHPKELAAFITVQLAK